MLTSVRAPDRFQQRGAIGTAAICCFYILGGLALWWPVVMGDLVLYVRDLTLFAVPSKYYWTERLLAGELPLWTPWTGGGAPFLADVAHQVFYPPSLLAALGHNAEHGLGLFIAAHAIFTPVAMHWLLRTLDTRLSVACGCALVYGLSGYVLSIADNVVYLTASVWVPAFAAALLVACEGRHDTRRRLAWTAVGGVVLAMLVLAGDLVGIGCAMALAAALLTGQHLEKNTGVGRGAMLVLTLAVVLALGLSAVQWLPTLELLPQSVRAHGIDDADAGAWHLPATRLVEVVIPFFFGSAFHGEFLRPDLYPARSTPWAETLYLGWVPVGLAVIGLVLRPRLVWPVAGFLLVFVLFALGDAGVLQPVLARFVPGLDSVRYPEKWFVGVTVLLVVMSALGAEAACRRAEAGTSPRSALVNMLIVLCLFAGSLGFLFLSVQTLLPGLGDVISTFWSGRWPELITHRQGLLNHALAYAFAIVPGVILYLRGRAGGVKVLLAVAVLDLLWLHYDVAPRIDPALLEQARHSPVWATLETAEKHPRVLFDARPGTPKSIAIPDAIWQMLHNSGASARTPRVDWQHTVLRATAIAERNGGVVYGVRYLNGGFAALEIARDRQWLSSYAQSDAWGALALAGVQFVITPMNPRSVAFEGTGFEQISVHPELNARVIAVHGSRPRAHLVPRVAAFAEPRPQIPRELLNNASGEVTVVSAEPEHWQVEVEADGAGYALALTESFADGWRATVNTEPVETKAVAGRFLGVAVPQGRSTVSLHYKSDALAVGIATTAFTLLIVLALVAAGCRRAGR